MPRANGIASESADRVAKFWFCDPRSVTLDWVDDKERGLDFPSPWDPYNWLPVRRLTVNAVVAINMAFFRKALGMTQEELGDLIGWGKSVVSTAERSWEAKRVRNFTADDLISIADALGIPLAGLFLPPEDDGVAFRYVLEVPGAGERPLKNLLPAVLAGLEGNTPALEAFRQRLVAAGAAWMPDVIADASREADEMRAEARREADEILASAARQVAVTGESSERAEDAERESREHGVQDQGLDKAADVLAVAHQATDQAITDGRRDADATLGRARREAEHILELARRQAEQLTGDARMRAETRERDAQERHRQAIVDLVVQREELQRRVDDLRAFERDYRSRLRAFLEGQYRDLWAGTEGVDVDELIEAMRRQATERGARTVTAVLLGDDGIYDILRSDQAAEIASEQDGNASGYGTGPAPEEHGARPMPLPKEDGR
jgi:transcriptional regulator with XRE-family HTH domain